MSLKFPSKTKALSVEWVVEIYSYENVWPSLSDATSLAPVSILGTANSLGAIDSIKSTISKKIGQFTAENIISEKGIVAVDITRSKSRPDGECFIQCVGPLPRGLYSGSWVIVSTALIGKQVGSIIPRFIGQVSTVTSDYKIDLTGNIVVESSISIREWSNILTAPVKYDTYSIMMGVQQNAPGINLSIVADSLSKTLDGAQKVLKALALETLDPFELANFILILMGIMNSEDAVGKTPDPSIKLNNIALTTPDIPVALMERLGCCGVANQAKAAQTPFQSGFATTITGIQGKPVAYPAWDGVWGTDGINQYKQHLKETYKNGKKKQAVANGVGVLAMVGYSAWQILHSLCDEGVIDVFTDLWYEHGPQNSITAKPVLVYRDKPFLLQMFKDNKVLGYKDVVASPGSQIDLSGWTVFDHLPRVNVPSERIAGFRISNTFLTSPNYITTTYHAPGLSDSNHAAAAFAGRCRLEPEMRRFGGNELDTRTNFFGYVVSENQQSAANFIAESAGAIAGKNNQSPIEAWFQSLKSVYAAWHAYEYRMGTGVLLLKEDDLPISVGLNVSFPIGDRVLVGHVESVSFAYRIEADGNRRTATTIQLSRIVEQDSSSGSLKFLDITQLATLHR